MTKQELLSEAIRFIENKDVIIPIQIEYQKNYYRFDTMPNSGEFIFVIDSLVFLGEYWTKINQSKDYKQKMERWIYKYLVSYGFLNLATVIIGHDYDYYSV